MSTFIQLGFRHIVSPGAIDHLLFLLVLVAPYRFRDWRHLLGVASAFTLGHSITLAMVVTDTVRLPTALVEFLIPLTIVCAAVENLRRGKRVPRGWPAPLLAASFGLIHGAGFATFLREMFTGSVVVPLFSFNLGIELGQITVLTAALTTLTCVDRAIRLGSPRLGSWPRAALTSALGAGWAVVMAAQRVPW